MAISEEKGRALLLRAMDGQLGQEEQAELQLALAASETLRREQAQLEKMRGMLASLRPEPSQAFTGRVMNAVRQRQRETRILTWVTRVAAACLLIFALGLLSLYWPEGRLDTDAVLGLDSLSPDDAVTLLVE
ncbi:MAG: hypothetical protein KDC66_05835 [Phaeodactylibacter sp.]|nr:hypothetical protein [Phaeodactylibacter sp.]MCB9273115.1 hypothetical protein [Lewinellaceae bacterium]